MAMDETVRQHKFILDESEMPTAWYNIVPDLPSPPPPALHPGTLEPAGPDDFAPLFPMDLILQEVSMDRYIEIPGRRPRRLPAVAALARCSAPTGWSRPSGPRPGSTTSTRASARPGATSPTPRCPRRTTTPRPG